MTIKFHLQITLISLCLISLSACSLSKFTAHVTSLFIEDSITLLNAEKDLLKVKKQLPENIAQLENMLRNDNNNKRLHIYAAQAYYGYAFSFIEDNNKNQAIDLYYKAYNHAMSALTYHGITAKDLQGKSPGLQLKVDKLSKPAVDALYWTAISWAKLIEIKQPELLLFTQLHKTAILMNRVIQLDEAYHSGGAFLFFAVYYGGRPDFLGGNDYLSKKYFERARSFNKNRLLMVDFLQAKYLNGRLHGKEKYNQRLLSIINAPDDLYPEQALMNAVAKQKASILLKRL
ncbi:MAG: TRAP transporter TatT component family protein [Gammaproteobacteria bacterium]|nr:TRAP transporter TatT component family protein [Gammaproteobacteria bacterium]